MTQEILWLILIGIVALTVVWLITRAFGTTPQLHGLQKEVNMRLTYKRYMELYPETNITYEQYKKMQAQHAYKKAVSSTKIKRMVR